MLGFFTSSGRVVPALSTGPFAGIILPAHSCLGYWSYLSTIRRHSCPPTVISTDSQPLIAGTGGWLVIAAGALSSCRDAPSFLLSR